MDGKAEEAGKAEVTVGSTTTEVAPGTEVADKVVAEPVDTPTAASEAGSESATSTAATPVETEFIGAAPVVTDPAMSGEGFVQMAKAEEPVTMPQMTGMQPGTMGKKKGKGAIVFLLLILVLAGAGVALMMWKPWESKVTPGEQEETGNKDSEELIQNDAGNYIFAGLEKVE